VQAQRTRKDVIKICQELLGSELPASRRDAKETRYWVLATMAEAYLGIGDEAEFKKWIRKAYSASPTGWMKKSTDTQIAKLRKLLEKPPLAHT
jgi:hypothetical protein